jgi:rod shape-determining protein MreC
VFDKQVRRRRIVLVLLVLCSLILLTAYFGASPSSPLHSVQQGIAEVMSPIEDGASKVLSPVRDVFGWFSQTIHAKDANKQLKADNATLTRELDQAEYAIAENDELKRELHLVQSTNVSQYGLVWGEVIAEDPIVWYQTIQVSVGTGQGVRLYDPVIGNGGLVGDVTAVGSNEATVSEFSAPKFAVGALVLDGSDPGKGVLQPAVGNPTNLQLNYLPLNSVVNPGDAVITSGFSDPADPQIASCYPPAIPIGSVASASYDSQTNTEQVDVTPAVDLRQLSVVQILTTHLPVGC